jgi:DNA-binding NtrC family response regulator
MLAILCGRAGQEQIPFSLLGSLDDYIFSPFHPTEFTFRIRRLLTGSPEVCARDEKLQHERLREVVGDSPALCQVLAKIPLIAACDSTCLLEGETGTGKELFARAIHYMGPRHNKPFVPVNCGAFPDHLIENELFGHAKGAFTDASSSEPGLIAYAQDGTLFLDEVDALSLAAQVKLLRLLQEHEYRQVGSPRILRSNARIIAASNADLRQAIAARDFREDLYHRLNVLRLPIPALRDRAGDIPILATHFLYRYAEKHKKNVRHLSGGAQRKLATYSWPGNVRELEGVIQRAVLMSEGPFVQAADIDLGDSSLPEDSGRMLPLRAAKAKLMCQFERSYLIEVLTTHCGNVSHAARAAGRERRSFQRLIKKHSINIHDFRTN